MFVHSPNLSAFAPKQPKQPTKEKPILSGCSIAEPKLEIPVLSESEKKMTDRIVIKDAWDPKTLQWIAFALSGKMEEGPTRSLTRQDIGSSYAPSVRAGNPTEKSFENNGR